MAVNTVRQRGMTSDLAPMDAGTGPGSPSALRQTAASTPPAMRPPDGGGRISSPYLVSPTRPGNTTPMVAGDVVGRRQGSTLATQPQIQPTATEVPPSRTDIGRQGASGGGVDPRLLELLRGGRTGPAAGMPRPRPSALTSAPTATPSAASTGALPGTSAALPAQASSAAGLADGGSSFSPPPAAASPSVPQNVGPLGTDAIGLGNLGALIERQLAQPGGFGSAEAIKTKEAFDQMSQRQERQGMAGINADLARRGVFHSSAGVPDIANLQTDLAGARAMADAQLLGRVADSQQSGLNSAIGNAMGYMGLQGQQDLTDAQLGSLASQVGLAGQSGLANLGQLAHSMGLGTTQTLGQLGLGAGNLGTAQTATQGNLGAALGQLGLGTIGAQTGVGQALGQLGLGQQAGLGQLGQLMAGLGYQDAPSFNQALQLFGMQPNAAGGGIDPNLFSTLGSLFQGGQMASSPVSVAAGFNPAAPNLTLPAMPQIYQGSWGDQGLQNNFHVSDVGGVPGYRPNAVRTQLGG